MSIQLVMLSNHLILCRPLLLPSIFSSKRVFSNESVLHITWPKYCSFRFSIRPSNEHPGLISFRMDWLDLLAVLGTLKSLHQHHDLKAPISLCIHLLKALPTIVNRLPCPLSSPGTCSNSCPLSQWCDPTILSIVIPFSFCLQSFPASGSLPMNQLFA